QVQAIGAGETTTDTFTYTVDNGQGGTDTATVTITVAGSDDPLFAMDTTDAAGRYVWGGSLDFDAASLFGGGSGAISYSYALLQQPAGNTGWLTQTGTIFGGNPGWLAANTGAYLYEVTATDATSSATSYVAFHAFNNDSRRE